MYMELEKQVCSLELAKRLKKLGAKQESVFYWVDYKSAWCLREKAIQPQDCSAFTVAELGDMLPKLLKTICSKDGNWWVHTDDWSCCANTEADARANMLIYLIEEGLVNPKESV